MTENMNGLADLATSGAVEGLTFFMMAWIQFLRIPAVMADRVCTPSCVLKLKNNFDFRVFHSD